MQAIDVYCVNVGDKYGREYVYKLKEAVKRHLSLSFIIIIIIFITL